MLGGGRGPFGAARSVGRKASSEGNSGLAQLAPRLGVERLALPVEEDDETERARSELEQRNATLAAIQNYTIHEHPNDANRVMTGTQDNGMAGTATGSLVWPHLTAGDGGYGVYLNEVYTTLFTT